MSMKAGIVPHLTNHCVRATLITVLSESKFPGRYICNITDHKSEVSLASYNDRASIETQEAMSDKISSFIDKENVPAQKNQGNVSQSVPDALQVNMPVVT